jgi:hypothetical protein
MRLRIQDAGYKIQDARYKMQDPGCRMQDLRIADAVLLAVGKG